MKTMSLPVCTLSPICSSDITTDLPFWRLRLAVAGKHTLGIFGLLVPIIGALVLVVVGVPSQQ